MRRWCIAAEPVVKPPPPWRASVHKPPAGPPPAHLLVKPDAGVLNILLILLWYFAHSTLVFAHIILPVLNHKQNSLKEGVKKRRKED